MSRPCLTLYLLVVSLVALSPLRSDAALVAHWPLDTDASDATGNGHDGAVVGGTVNFGQPGASAVTGSAAAFPNNGHIDVPYAAALNPGIQAPNGSGSFTISLWANSSNNSGFNSPFTAREDNGVSVNGPIIYNNSSGNWSYWAGNNGPPGAWNPLDDGPVPLNTWQHVAVTYDSATQTRKMFIDGSEVLSANLGVSANVLRDIHIGSGQDNGANFYWNGLIDDVGFYNEALLQSGVQFVIDNGISELPRFLMVDFNSTTQDGGPHPEAGYYRYDAAHEVSASFTTQSYRAFGATIDLTPEWPNTTGPGVRQMIDRSAGNDNNWNGTLPDLVTDWIGADTRTGGGGNGNYDGTTGTPTFFDLRLAGLPADNYQWTSFHHDTEHMNSRFQVELSTDGGTSFTPIGEFRMTDSTAGGSPASPMVFTSGDPHDLPSTVGFPFTAAGPDVVVRFICLAEIAVHNQFVGVNGFELTLAADDTGTADEDSILTTIDPGGAEPSLLTNDNSAVSGVLFADGTSDLGAAVSVNADGTFTYDPTGVAAFQALAAGSTATDCFEYTAAVSSAIVPGVTLNFDAQSDTDGNAVWESTTANQSRNWTLGANLTRDTAPTGAPTGITAAYNFPTVSPGATVANHARTASYDSAFNENTDATWECWLKADTTASDMIVWETGGSGDGASLTILSGQYRFTIKHGANNLIKTAPVPDTTQFHQVVAVYDRDASGTDDTLRLYVDGAEVGGPTVANPVHDWSGGDAAALGGRNGSTTGGTGAGGTSLQVNTLDGQIAIFRFYESKAFTPGEVGQNFDSVTNVVPDTAKVTITVTGSADPPTALAAAHNVDEDGPAGTFAFGSTDPDAGEAANHRFSILTAPAAGTLVNNNNGTFTYDPAGAFESLAPGELATISFDFDALNPTVAMTPAPVPTLDYNGTLLDGTPGTLEAVPTLTLNDWIFGGDVTQVAVTSTVSGLTNAYRFTGGTGAENRGLNDLTGDPSDNSATWEFWLRPADTGDGDQIIFETGGGGDGMAVWYTKGIDADGMGILKFTIDNGGVQRTVQAPIDNSDFRHVAAVYSRDDVGTTDRMELYIDGFSVDVDATTTGLNDWDGGDPSGLGNLGAGGLAQTAANGEYEGDLAVFRFYEQALTAAEVKSGYALSSTATVTIDIHGQNDGPTANDDAFAVSEDGPGMSNVLTGAGADTDPDINGSDPEDSLSVQGLDLTGTSGTATTATAQEIAVVGTVTVTTAGVTVPMGRDFTNPVVIALPLGIADPAPAITQVTNVDASADTFDIRLIEPPNLDGVHADEPVSFLVVEAGTWQLPNGALLEAATVDTDTTTNKDPPNFQVVNFLSSFGAAPVVLSQTQTLNETDGDEWFKTRQRDTTASKFDVALEEAEGAANQTSFGSHATERIGYVAIEAGSGGWSGLVYEAGLTANNVIHTFTPHSFDLNFNSAPNLLAAMSTRGGADPTHLRFRNLTGTGVEFSAEEDTNLDGEIGHAAETVNYLALGGSGILSGFLQSDVIGKVTYDPNGQFESLNVGDTATDTFDYTVIDSFGNTDTATVTVTINGVNDAPTITGSGIPDQCIFTSNPTIDVPLFPHFQDVDNDDNELTYTVTMNTNGTLIQTSPISSVDGILTLDTPCTLVGTADITVEARDPGGLFVTDTFTVEVKDDVPPFFTGIKDKVYSAPVGGSADASAHFAGIAAADKVDGPIGHTCTLAGGDPLPAGNLFPVGVHPIECTAQDSATPPNVTTVTFNIIVLEIQSTPGVRLFDLVTLRGDPVSGAGIPAGATLSNVQRAFLNNSDEIIYAATLAGAGANNAAVFTGTLAAQTAIATKNTASGVGDYGIFSNLSLNDAAHAAFESRISANPGHFLDSGGGPLASARKNLAAPTGGGELFGTLQKPALTSGGELLTRANLVLGSGAGVTIGDDTVVTSSAGTVLAREGDASSVAATAYDQIHPRIVASEDNNHYAFSAFLLEDAGFDPIDNTGLFTGTVGGGLPALVARENDPAPEIAGATLKQFLGEAVNSSGELAIRCNLAGTGVNSTNNEALYTNTGGSLVLVAREGDVAPCLPDNLAAFKRFETFYMGDDGSVCFRAFLQNATATPVIHSGNDGSVWRWKDGELHLVAREGDMANNTDGAVIRTIDGFSCSGAGGITYWTSFVPGLGDSVTSNNLAVFLDRGAADAAPELILRRRDLLDLGGGEFRRVVGIKLSTEENNGGGTGGYGRTINDAGNVLLNLTLSRNQSGIFVLSP